MSVITISPNTISNADSLTLSGNGNQIEIGRNNLINITGSVVVSGSINGNPAGTVIMVAMQTAPTGYLKCNGAEISRTTYSALFTAIGTEFGSGDGSTTFNIPDLRGYFVRGWNEDGTVDPLRAFGTVQDDAFQGHYHRMETPYGTAGGTGFLGGSYKNFTTTYTDLSCRARESTDDGTNGTPRTASETRPINVSLLYCIKT